MAEENVISQEKFDEVVNQRDGLKTDLREIKEKHVTLEGEIATLKKGVLSAEDLKLFKELKDAKEKLEGVETVTKSEMQRIREEDTKKHLADVEQAKIEADTERQKLDAEIDRLTVDSQIELAVIGSGVQRSDEKDVVAQVVQLIKPTVKREKTDDGNYRVVCMDAELNIRQTPDGIMPVNEHVTDFLNNNTHFLPSSGSGPRVPNRISGSGGTPVNYWDNSSMDNVEAIYNK